MVDGNKLKSVLELTYLGSTISSNGCIDDEIQRRMAKASASFGRLRQRLWNNHHVFMRVKGKIYRAIVCCLPCYMETRLGQCTDDRRKKLHNFMMRHLRSIMRITWMDKVTNKEILERTGLPSMEDLLIRKKSPVDWTPYEDVTIQAAKAGSFLSTVFWSWKERPPSSPVQGYHQEKPEAERHKDRLMDITLTAER